MTRMMRVELAPRARAQVLRIDTWWREHRLAAPSLFADELSEALDLLQQGAVLGARYPFAPFVVLRFLLPRSRYHVYYSVDGDLVKVRAVWHGKRGKGPPLR